MTDTRVPAYRSLYFPGLLGFEGNPAGIFSERLSESEFRPYEPLYDGTLIYGVENAYLKDIFAGIAKETELFSSKLFETLIALQRTHNDKSLTWQFVKIYYAAFYAVQIIMRLTGFWPSRLSALDKYEQLLQIYDNKTIVINSGIFLCRYDEVDKFFCKPIEDEVGKSHRNTWKSFIYSISYSAERLKNISEYKSNEVIGDLTKLILDLGKDGDFLNNIRNSINYKTNSGLWYPADRLARREWNIYLNLINVQLTVTSPPQFFPRANSDFQKYLASCRFIIDLALWMMSDISSIRPKNKFLHTKYNILIGYLNNR